MNWLLNGLQALESVCRRFSSVGPVAHSASLIDLSSKLVFLSSSNLKQLVYTVDCLSSSLWAALQKNTTN